MRTVTTHEAKTHLSQLLSQVLSGEEVVICRGALPVARLVTFSSVGSEGAPKRPPVGTITSEPVVCAPDCFDVLTEEELKDWGL